MPATGCHSYYDCVSATKERKNSSIKIFAPLVTQVRKKNLSTIVLDKFVPTQNLIIRDTCGRLPISLENKIEFTQSFLLISAILYTIHTPCTN